MTDYPALPPCPSRKSGRHRGTSWGLDREDNVSLNVVWVCRACGMARYIDGSDNTPRPLDDLSAAEIERRIRGMGL